MIRLTIDGMQLAVTEGATVLEAAQSNGIWIPTLCHHESLTPYGGCRLCAVEILQGKQTRIVSSCTYTVEEGMRVITASDTVLAIRKCIIALLLAEAPDAKILRELADEIGAVPYPGFTVRNELCIACGRCIRACREIVGVQAIDFAHRGYKRVAAAPFFERSEDCIGCGTCAAVCPTGAITMKDIPEGAQDSLPDGTNIEGPARIIDNWKVSFALKRCAKCGEPFAPQFQLEYFTAKAQLPADFFDVCRECRQ